MGTSRTAVVVGAGLSGLAAAFRLQQAGVSVIMLEQQDKPGGRVRTVRENGYIVDVGPDAMTESYKSYLGMLDELGMSDRIEACSPVVGLVRGGRVIDADPRRTWNLIRSPMLSLRAKIRIGWGFIRLRKVLRDVDAYELVRSSELDDPDSNAWELGRRYFGAEAADYLVDPVARLVTGVGGRGASTLNLLGALKSWTVPAINIRGGLEALPSAIAEHLDIRYGAEVTGVAESGSGVTVTYVDDDGHEQTLVADSCVIGAMFHVAREIWPALEGCAPEFAAHLENARFVTVSLGYRVRAVTESYIVQVPSVEYPDCLLIFMQHNKAPDRAPAGHSLVTMYTDTSVTDRYLDRSDEELEAWAAGIVESVCPELTGHRDLAVIARWPKAGYLATPGFWRRSAALLDAVPTSGRIQLAGDLFGAGSMESAIRWGERAATRILRQDAGSPAAAPGAVTPSRSG